MMPFHDRREAGRLLARFLTHHRYDPDAVVLALPRGGVPVGLEVARAIDAPLDVFLVRKLGVPGREELALGALAAGGVRVLNPDIVWRLKIPMDVIDRITSVERRELERRERLYRAGRPLLQVRNRTVILVDDGLATGSTMSAAITALRQMGARRIVVAVPVAAPETCARLGREADEIVCAATPEPFLAVGQWYQDFSQVTDEEVRELLDQAAEARST